MTTYQNQQAWKDFQTFLPKELHFTSDYEPNEEIWNWKENKVHLDTFRNKNAKAKIICFHGVGSNARQISMIFAGPMAKEGFETISVDMPTYGVTKVNPQMTISYDDWVQCGSDLIDAELEKDNRPIFLYGLSAGGMETYHVASKNKKVKGIIGMTFLDQRKSQVRLETTNNAFWAKIGVPLAGIQTKIGLGRRKMKLSTSSKMWASVNNKRCLDVLLKDETSAGISVTMKFIHSYMNYQPDIEPKDFNICPILLTQPEKDKCSPLHLSDLVLDNISKVKVKKVILRNGSHFPIEKEALEDLHEASLNFIKRELKI